MWLVVATLCSTILEGSVLANPLYYEALINITH